MWNSEVEVFSYFLFLVLFTTYSKRESLYVTHIIGSYFPLLDISIK